MCVELVLVALGLYLILRPAVRPLPVVTVSIGSTVYQRFTVRPGSFAVMHRGTRVCGCQDSDGWYWGGVGPVVVESITNVIR